MLESSVIAAVLFLAVAPLPAVATTAHLSPPCGALCLEGAEGDELEEGGHASGTKTAAWGDFLLAKILEQEDAPDRALALHQAALLVDPADAYLRLELASLLYRLDRHTEADAQAREAARLAPESPELPRLLGGIALERARSDPRQAREAERQFKRALELDPSDLRSAASLAHVRSARGDVDGAAAVFDAFIASEPASVAARFYLGQLLERSGNAARAVEVYRQALTLDADQPQIQAALVQLLEKLDRLSEARVLLEGMAARDPRSAEVLRQLGLAQFLDNRWSEAAASFERALALSPGDFRLRFYYAASLANLDRFAESNRLLVALERDDPGNLDVSYQLALNGVAAKRWDEAERRFAALLAAVDRGAWPRERETGLRQHLALVQYRARKHDAALATLAPALVDPASPPAALLAAEVWRAKGGLPQAILLLDEVLANQPRASWARARLAELRFLAGDTTGAVDLLRQLTEGTQVSDFVLAGETYLRLGLPARALEVYGKGLRCNPRDPQLMFLAGATAERTGRHEEAEIALRELLAQAPNHAAGLNHLAYMWAERGENLGEALVYVERAVRLEPDNAAYADSLGWVLYNLHRYDEAVAELARASSLLPDDATVQEHLGDAYWACGHRQAARQAWRRALDLGAEDEDMVRAKLESAR